MIDTVLLLSAVFLVFAILAGGLLNASQASPLVWCRARASAGWRAGANSYLIQNERKKSARPRCSAIIGSVLICVLLLSAGATAQGEDDGPEIFAFEAEAINEGLPQVRSSLRLDTPWSPTSTSSSRQT